MNRVVSACIPSLISLCFTAYGADWLTDGGNSTRNNWQKDETTLSKANVGNLHLLWSQKLDNQPRQMHSLLEPLVIGEVATSGGNKSIVIQAGVSDNVFALDAKTGELIWKRHFESTFEPDPGERYQVLCPGGMTSNVTIGPGSAAGKYIIYAVAWDGRLHQLNAADGEELATPSLFMPPNGKPYALNLVDNVIYTHSGQGCGGNPNMAYSYDLQTHKVGSWGPAGGGMWGRSGPAVSKEKVEYTGTGDGRWNPENGLYGNGIIGVKQNTATKALDLVDYYGPANAEWLWKRDLDMQVTPSIFDFKSKEYMVDASKECRVYLMNTESIGGDDHRTPVYRTPLICNEMVDFAQAGIWGSLASWEDGAGNRWVLAPFWGAKHPQFKAPMEYGDVKKGAIAAFKMQQDGANVKLAPAWVSRDMNQAEPPLIANGMVFAYGSGENTSQAFPDVGLDFRMERRVPLSSHAVLYALDAQTGKELWSSGDQIKTWNHWSGLALANGQVYINTFDGTLYCFGLQKVIGARLSAVLAVLSGTLLAGQQSTDDALLQKEVDAYRRVLMDWGGLIQYGSDDAELQVHPDPNRVVFLGDEITGKWGAKGAEFFPGKPYVNRGIERQTTAQMLVRFRQDVIDLSPKVVVIEAGTNDIASVMGPSSEGTMAEHFMSMVELAKAHGIKVVLASVTPVCDCFEKMTTRRSPGKIISLNKWLKSYAEESGAVYLDYYSALVEGRQMKKNFTDDGLIPNVAGYRVMASLAESAIQQASSK